MKPTNAPKEGKAARDFARAQAKHPPIFYASGGTKGGRSVRPTPGPIVTR